MRKQFTNKYMHTANDLVVAVAGAGGDPAAEPDNLHMHPIDEAFLKNIIKITEENLEDFEFGILRLK